MTHTHDTLMALAAAYATEQLHAHYHPAMEARAALSTAIAEVLAERDALANNLQNATTVLQSVLNGRTSPQLAQEVVNALNDALDAARGLKGTPT